MSEPVTCEHCGGRGWNPPEGATVEDVRAARQAAAAPGRERARERIAAGIARMRAEGRMPASLLSGPDEYRGRPG